MKIKWFYPDDIEVQVIEEKGEVQTWAAKCEFGPADVHKQVTVVHISCYNCIIFFQLLAEFLMCVINCYNYIIIHNRLLQLYNILTIRPHGCNFVKFL